MAFGYEKPDVCRRSIGYVTLDRMPAMLSRLGKHGCFVQKEPVGYGVDPDLLAPSPLRSVDFDLDFDFPAPYRLCYVDPGKANSQPDAALDVVFNQ